MIKKRLFTAALIAAIVIVTIPAAFAETNTGSVLYYGSGVGTGGDDTAAFQAALDSAVSSIFVPAGNYSVSSVNIPEGKTLYGSGRGKTNIYSRGDADDFMFTIGHMAAMRDISLINEGDKKIGIHSGLWEIKREPPDTGSIYLDLFGITITDMSIVGFKQHAIAMDHVGLRTITDTMWENGSCGFRISRVRVDDIGAQGINITQSKYGIVENCYVTNADSGIQFWNGSAERTIEWPNPGRGHYKFIGNTVKHVAEGGIWGARAEHVLIQNNFIEDCGDVGLDLERCFDSKILDNTAINYHNAGISLFFSCENIEIARNRVINKSNHTRNRAGIWLVGQNLTPTEQAGGWAYDYGHKNISIHSNTIYTYLNSGKTNTSQPAILIVNRITNNQGNVLSVTASNNVFLGGSGLCHRTSSSSDTNGTLYTNNVSISKRDAVVTSGTNQTATPLTLSLADNTLSITNNTTDRSIITCPAIVVKKDGVLKNIYYADVTVQPQGTQSISADIPAGDDVTVEYVSFDCMEAMTKFMVY